MADDVVISNGELTARINPLGAELLSLQDTAGREYMTDADPAYWTGHAPVLFPIVGALNGGSYRLDGREYPLAKHGFARGSMFACEKHEKSGRVRFALEASDETRRAYPFEFRLELYFELRDRTLAMTATVSNAGVQPMPFSFGFHPAFAWPLPGGGEKLAHDIVFEHDEPQDIRRIHADGLVAGHEATPVRGDRFSLAPDLFEDDALIWDELASRRLSYRGMNGAALDIAFPDTPMLGIWQKPGANFICIEPWAGIADPAGFAGDFRDKPGIMLLEPGASRSFGMDVTVRQG